MKAKHTEGTLVEDYYYFLSGNFIQEECELSTDF